MAERDRCRTRPRLTRVRALRQVPNFRPAFRLYSWKGALAGAVLFGLGRVVALGHRASIYTRFANIFGAALSDAAM
jgi:hypothetical protein